MNESIRQKFLYYLEQQLVGKIQGVATDLAQLQELVGEHDARELAVVMKGVRAQLAFAAASLTDAFLILKDYP